MSKLRPFGLVMIVAVLAGFAALFGSRTPEPLKIVTYAIIPRVSDDPAFQLARLGAERAAHDLEAEHPGTQYKIIYEPAQNGVASEQADAIAELATKKVDGIGISVIDPSTATKPIDDAVAAGARVICFESDAPGSNRLSFYTVDNVAMGETLVTQLMAAIRQSVGRGSAGEIAVMSGRSSEASLSDRLKGVRLWLREYPRMSVLPILYCDDDTDKAVAEIRVTMRAHPKLRGLILLGSWPLLAKGALGGIDPKVTKVVAVDALDSERDYMRQGKVQCLVAERCYDWGMSSVHILENIRTGVYRKTPKIVHAGYDVVLMTISKGEANAGGRAVVACYSLAGYDDLVKEWHSPPPPAYHLDRSWHW